MENYNNTQGNAGRSVQQPAERREMMGGNNNFRRDFNNREFNNPEAAAPVNNTTICAEKAPSWINRINPSKNDTTKYAVIAIGVGYGIYKLVGWLRKDKKAATTEEKKD